MAVVKTDVSEKRSGSITRLTRIGKLGTTSQKTSFLIVTAMKTSNITKL
jgi:hypothetical protein